MACTQNSHQHRDNIGQNYIFSSFLGKGTRKLLTLSSSNGKRNLAGGMAEWFKAAVLKTVVRKYRGFESYFLRQFLYCLWGEVTERPMVLAC